MKRLNDNSNDITTSKIVLEQIIKPAKTEISGLCEPGKARAKENHEYNLALERQAKSQQELVAIIDCEVESVIRQPVTMIISAHKTKMGGQSAVQTTTNYTTEIVIKTDEKVNRLYLPANQVMEYGESLCNLRQGDNIRAYIMKCEEQYGKIVGNCLECAGKKAAQKDCTTWFPTQNMNKPTYLIERPFKEREQPFKIEKLVGDTVVATYITNAL